MKKSTNYLFITALLSLVVIFSWGQGTAAAEESQVCWKDSYGRGVGKIPGSCNLAQTKSGLLCYQDCKPGYKVVAGVCWQQCPAEGFRDTGGLWRHVRQN